MIPSILIQPFHSLQTRAVSHSDRPRRCRKNRGRRGSVLVGVIWMLSMLTIFCLAISRRASQELVLGRWVKEQVTTRSLMKAGIERVRMELQVDKFKAFDALNEPWASNPDAFKNVEMPGGNWSVECQDSNGQAGGYFVRYGACDEAARINLNIASEQTLVNLIKAAAKDIDPADAVGIAQAILDWRDSDDAAMVFGAETPYYRFLNPPYDARNAPLESVEELQMIKGVTPELYQRLKNDVTVYTKGEINFNTVSYLSLRALNLSDDLIVKIFKFRAGGDKEIGTKDDGIFQSASQIAPTLSNLGTFSGEEFKQITDALGAGKVGVTSSVFRIRSISRLLRSEQDLQTGVTAVVNRDGEFLYWSEM